MYDWLSRRSDKFWLILNYSKVVWDIDTKFSPVVILISFQLSTKFEEHNSLKKTAMPLGSSKWKWAWQANFLSHTYETQKICCFLADVQIILASLFELSNYLKVAKKAGAFLSRCSELLGLWRQRSHTQIDSIFWSRNIWIAICSCPDVARDISHSHFIIRRYLSKKGLTMGP